MSLAPPTFRTSAGAAAGGLLAAGILLPFVCYGFSWDQMVFSALADVLCHGGVLYRDAWEHKPPGVYWTYYLTFALLGRDFWILRAVEIAAIAMASAGLVLVALRWMASGAAAAVAAITLPTTYFLFLRNSAQPETFQIPLLVWGLVLWPDHRSERRVAVRAFCSGVLLSGVVLFKTPAVLLLPLFLVDRLVSDRHETSITGKVRLTGITAAGMLLVPALMTAYYASRGAFPQLLDALITFPYRYSGLGDHGLNLHYRMAMDWMSWLVPWPFSILLLVGMVRGFLFRKGVLVRWALLAAAAVGSVVIQAKYFPYHHILLTPVLALGASLAFLRPPLGPEKPARSFEIVDRVLSGLAMMMGLVAAVHYAQALEPLWSLKSGLARIGTVESAEPRTEDPFAVPQTIDHADLLRQITTLTGPEDRIFVWGDDPSLYFLSNRRMAGPYCHLLLIVPPWGGTERVEALIRRLDREKPPLVIVTPGIHFWRGLSTTALLEQYPEMKEYIRDQYALLGQGVGYQIWKRTN